MALSKFRAPPLPIPPQQYDAAYSQQLNRALQIYFSQLDSATPNYAESYTADNFYGSGTGLVFPHNQFISVVDQSAAAIDEAYAVQLEITTFNDGITITGASDTQITFASPGIYMITYSLAFKNPTNDAQSVDIWLRYNDGTGAVDVPNSNSRFTIPARKSTGDPSYLIAVTPFSGYAQAANVWVEVMWHTTDINVTMEHLPAVTYSAGVTPDIPVTPSAIVEVQFLSKAVA